MNVCASEAGLSGQFEAQPKPTAHMSVFDTAVILFR
jgi:hypothetical protein